MKPTKPQIRKWCEALRSGKYSQTTGKLQDEKGYCCLGVACDVFIPKEKQDLKHVFLSGEFPLDQFSSPIWLTFVNVSFSKQTHASLSELNDDHDLTFDEIADCLEAVYIHEVLA